MIWLIDIAGVALIGFIVWWFWLYRPVTAQSGGDSVIEVHVRDGVYDPAYIRGVVGQPLHLSFVREDATPRAEYVVFEAFAIQKQLPLDEPVAFTLTPQQAGEFDFTCQMNMYRGKLIVEEES